MALKLDQRAVLYVKQLSSSRFVKNKLTFGVMWMPSEDWCNNYPSSIHVMSRILSMSSREALRSNARLHPQRSRLHVVWAFLLVHSVPSIREDVLLALLLLLLFVIPFVFPLLDYKMTDLCTSPKYHFPCNSGSSFTSHHFPTSRKPFSFFFSLSLFFFTYENFMALPPVILVPNSVIRFRVILAGPL